MKPYISSKHGFSLVEMSVVLLVISSLIGISVTLAMTQVDIAKIQSTRSNISAIREALHLFQMKYNRYPCPARPTEVFGDTNYGVEQQSCFTDCSGLTCNGNAIVGYVPFVSLNLSNAASYDGWNHRITYAIDRDHVILSEFGNGSLEIIDKNGNQITSSSAMGDAIFVLIGHGNDRKGAYNERGTMSVPCGTLTADSENCDADDIFMSTNMNDHGNPNSETNYFNDFVLWEGQKKIPVTVIPQKND